MTCHPRFTSSSLVICTAGLGWITSLPVFAQDLGSMAAANAAFDQQMAATLQTQVQQNQMAQQQLMQA